MAEEREKFMTGKEYYDITFGLGKNLRSMGMFLRIGQRTSYRYAYDESVKIPGPTADLLRLLKANKVTFEQIEKVRPASVKPVRKKTATAKKK